MAKYVPPTFNQAQVLDGLRKAMGFGEPNLQEDKPAFEIPVNPDISASVAADSSGVPFDPEKRPSWEKRIERISCAYDFKAGPEDNEPYGSRENSKVELCILGPEWQLVRDFTHVTIGGDRYLRTKTVNLALGSIDVVLVTAISEDEK